MKCELQYMQDAGGGVIVNNSSATVNGIESTLLPQAPKDPEGHYLLAIYERRV
jgi:hypothetical protein